MDRNLHTQKHALIHPYAQLSVLCICVCMSMYVHVPKCLYVHVPKCLSVYVFCFLHTPACIYANTRMHIILHIQQIQFFSDEINIIFQINMETRIYNTPNEIEQHKKNSMVRKCYAHMKPVDCGEEAYSNRNTSYIRSQTSIFTHR